MKKVLRILTENILPQIRPTPQRPILLGDFVTFNLFVISILFPILFLNLLAAKFLEALKKDCIIDSLWTRGWGEAVRQVGSHSIEAYEVRSPGETPCGEGYGPAGTTGCPGIKESLCEF